MARKRNSGDEGDAGTWLNTYADMVTLLLTFFAVLISMSSIDQEKFEQVMQSFQAEVVATSESGAGAGSGTGIPTDGSIKTMDELYEHLKEYIEQNNQQDAVSLSKNADVIYLRFSSDLFFLPNQYTLLSTSYPTLEFIGQGLKSCENIIRMVEIAGHTAAVQGKTNVSDWRLSGERAATVAIYLEDEIGFTPEKLKIEGYGKRYPVADNSTEEGRRQNRRVEMLIIGNDSTLAYPDAYESIQGLFNPDLYPAQGGANDFITPPAGEPQTPEEVAEQVEQAMQNQAASQAQESQAADQAAQAQQDQAVSQAQEPQAAEQTQAQSAGDTAS